MAQKPEAAIHDRIMETLARALKRCQLDSAKAVEIAETFINIWHSPAASRNPADARSDDETKGSA